MKSMTCSCGHVETADTVDGVIEKMMPHVKEKHPAEYAKMEAYSPEEREKEMETLRGMVKDVR